MKQLLKEIFWTAIAAGAMSPLLSYGLKHSDMSMAEKIFGYITSIVLLAKIGTILANNKQS